MLNRTSKDLSQYMLMQTNQRMMQEHLRSYKKDSDDYKLFPIPEEETINDDVDDDEMMWYDAIMEEPQLYRDSTEDVKTDETMWYDAIMEEPSSDANTMIGMANPKEATAEDTNDDVDDDETMWYDAIMEELSSDANTVVGMKFEPPRVDGETLNLKSKKYAQRQLRHARRRMMREHYLHYNKESDEYNLFSIPEEESAADYDSSEATRFEADLVFGWNNDDADDEKYGEEQEVEHEEFEQGQGQATCAPPAPLRRSKRLANKVQPPMPLVTDLRRSPRVARMPRVSYVGMF